MDLKNKKVTVVGLGNSGANAAMLLDDIGARVFATDGQDTESVRKSVAAFGDRRIWVELGKHSKDFIIGSDLVVISPGVEDSSPPVKWAMELGIPIISEMELGYMFCKGKIIAITGTNGKSTVTTLIGQMLKDGGLDTVVCGNIGNSLSGEVRRIGENAWVVLEVSSFQLEKIKKFRPVISIILNITDDHMDRYTKFQDYFNEKLKIFKNQKKGDTLILNYDAENLRPLKDLAGCDVLFYSRFKETGGAYMKDGDTFVGNKKICAGNSIPLRGDHNVENVLAASLAASLAGVDEVSIRRTIRGFKGLAHRVETVDVINGVEYVDDSKGTTVDSTYRAIESSRKPVILIAGGKDKNSDYRYVRDAVRKKVKHLILIGEAATRIRQALEDLVRTHEAKTMDEAVSQAYRLADKGDMVLLSPMCSSFDMYRDYKHRGDVFKSAVMAIKSKTEKCAT